MGDSGRRKIHRAAAHHAAIPAASGTTRVAANAAATTPSASATADAQAIVDAPATPPRSMATRPTNTPRVSPLGASVHGADRTVIAAGAAAAQQVAAGDGDRQRLPAGRKGRLRDARAVDEHLDGVARPRLDRLQLQRDPGGQRRAGQLDAPEAGRPAAGQAAVRGCRPEAGEEGRVAGRPRTMADDSGAATSRAAKIRAAARAAPSARRPHPLGAAGFGAASRARLRGGADRHRRTTSSPCSSWGRPSEPVREQ